MNMIERFAMLIYDRASHGIEINKTRRKTFAICNNVKRIPRTYDVLTQHVERATYQEGFIWSINLLIQQQLPSLCDWGIERR